MSPSIRAARARLCVALLATSLCAAQVVVAAEPIYPAASWTEAAPDASGWSPERLQAADDTARAIGTTAYLVVQHGVIVHAFGPVSRPMNLASARKSVLSVLYGIAVDRHQIDLGQTLAQLGITDKGGLSETEQGATIRELLQARSGVYHPAAYETAAMKKDRPPRGSHAPGTSWYYNNWDFNALGTIYQKLTGHSVFEGLQDELARPLHFEDFQRDRDTEFVSESSSDHPAYIMRISARDLARLGVLMARDGRWNGQQIVSAGWVRESTTSYSDTSPGVGYGYLWWVGQNGRHFQQRFAGSVFSARGNYGQFLLVDPVRDLVVVHRAEMDGPGARAVSGTQFNELLAKIMLAAPGIGHE